MELSVVDQTTSWKISAPGELPCDVTCDAQNDSDMAVKLEPILQTAEDESDVKVKGEHVLHGTFHDNVTMNGGPVFEAGLSDNVIVIQPVQEELNDVKLEYESETLSYCDASSEQYIDENLNTMFMYDAQIFETNEKQSKKSKHCRDEVYMCDLCGMEFMNRNELLLHICKEHVRKRALLCTICNTEVEKGDDALTHMESHATVKCLLCGLEDLPSINAMKVHIIEKHSDIRSCSLCDVGTDFNAESLADHIVEHQFKSDKRKCAFCTDYHVFPHRWYNHTLHASCFGRTLRKLFNRCCFCDYSNARMGEVAQHISKCHLSKGPSANSSELPAELKCPFNCTRKLKSPEQLSRHMIKKHESRTNVQCTFCKLIIQKHGIRKHLLDTHSSRQCPLCNVSFYGDNNQGAAELQDHLFSHDNPVQCPLCSEVQNGIEVEDHLKSVHCVDTV